MNWELWEIDQHPTRNDQYVIETIDAENFDEAIKKAKKNIPRKIFEVDDSHEDYVIFYSNNKYAYRLAKIN